MGQRRGLEGKPAAEPFRSPDLSRHPLHDARGAEPQAKLDLQKDTGAGDFRRPGHHPADDPPANPDDRPAVADVRHHRHRRRAAGRRLALAGAVERTAGLENHPRAGRRGLRPDAGGLHRHGEALRPRKQHPYRSAAPGFRRGYAHETQAHRHTDGATRLHRHIVPLHAAGRPQHAARHGRPGRHRGRRLGHGIATHDAVGHPPPACRDGIRRSRSACSPAARWAQA